MNKNVVAYKLATELIRGKASIFVGAGFSKNANNINVNKSNGFMLWGQLILELAKELFPYMSDNELKVKIAGEYLYIAQLYKEKFSEETFIEKVAKAIPDAEHLPSDLHKKLFALPWNEVITTNQDTLIERTYNELGIKYGAIINDNDIARISRFLNKRIIKLHGTINEPESIIFSENDYLNYKSKNPLLDLVTKSIFAQNTVVFIGFSMNDPNFKSIYNWVSEVLDHQYQIKSYAIMKSHIEPVEKKYWRRRNIEIVTLGDNFCF